MVTHRNVHPADSQLRLLTKVARMYHERGIRQAAIAQSLNISQAKVSRLLKRAVDAGIVRTTVHVAPGVYSESEENLEEKFGLREAVVVDLDPQADDQERTSALGAAAAGYLETTLSGHDRIGISSWSQTLLAMVDRMRPFPTPAAQSVVQLLGGIGVPAVQSQAHRLLGDLARMLRADAVYLQAPGVVANQAIRDGLLADAALQEVTRYWPELTLALVGIGRIQPSGLLAESGNAFSEADLARLRKDGAVGDVCHHFFTEDGQSIGGDLDSRTVSIPEDTFRKIPTRVGIAGGQQKAAAISAALKGEWINVLITDVHTADALMAQ